MDQRVLNSPVEVADRIESLDVLRGFAVLGILVMNIQSFAMPGAAYLNPTAYGDLNGINFFTWLVSYLLVDQKFMSIFSMLFGAGICLFADRAEARSGRSAGLHYRRTFYLLVFGLVHAYFLRAIYWLPTRFAAPSSFFLGIVRRACWWSSASLFLQWRVCCPSE